MKLSTNESFAWIYDLERAAHQGQVPGEDAALGLDLPADGAVLGGMEQLVGRVQAGAEQLETTQEDCHQVSSGNILTSNVRLCSGTPF